MRHEFGRAGMIPLVLFGWMLMTTTQVDAGVLFGRDTKVTTTQTPAQFVMVPMAAQPIPLGVGVPGSPQLLVATGHAQAQGVPTYQATSFAVEPQALAQAQSISLAAKFMTLRARLGQDITKLGGLITYLNQSRAGGTLHRGALLKMGIDFVAKWALGGVVPTDIIVDLTDLIDEFVFGHNQPSTTSTTPVLVPSSPAIPGTGPPSVTGLFQGKIGDQTVSGQISGTLSLTPIPSTVPPGPPPAGTTQTAPIQEISDSLLGLQSQVQSLHRKVDRISPLSR